MMLTTLQNIILMNVAVYIDYERLGEAIVEEGYYYELANGRVVEYNY